MDVSHELGALRFVVDSPLSSKVAMFNQQVNQHKQSQLLNPFSQTDGRASPKPTFSKDEYGKPLAGSLTEMRGQKANIHVLKEMLELCQIIDSEGYNVKDEPNMRVIPFGELFNIYNYISDKVVGILLRARKHKLVEFEGEMLFQRRDDDVPIFLLKPVHEIRREMDDKIESIKRCGSPAPQATSVLLDKRAHGLNVSKGTTPRSSVSRTPSPNASKSGTPVRETITKNMTAEPTVTTKIVKNDGAAEATKTEAAETQQSENITAVEEKETPKEVVAEQVTQSIEAKEQEKSYAEVILTQQQPPIEELQIATAEIPNKIDVNNNKNNNTNTVLPTIIIEATAADESPAKTEETSEADNATPITSTTVTSESNNVEPNAPVEPSVSA